MSQQLEQILGSERAAQLNAMIIGGNASGDDILNALAAMASASTGVSSSQKTELGLVRRWSSIPIRHLGHCWIDRE